MSEALPISPSDFHHGVAPTASSEGVTRPYDLKGPSLGHAEGGNEDLPTTAGESGKNVKRPDADFAIPWSDHSCVVDLFDISKRGIYRNWHVHPNIRRTARHWDHPSLRGNERFGNLQPQEFHACCRAGRSELLALSRRGGRLDNHKDALLRLGTKQL